MILKLVNILYVLIAVAMIGLILLQRGAGAAAALQRSLVAFAGGDGPRDLGDHRRRHARLVALQVDDHEIVRLAARAGRIRDAIAA